VVGEIIKLVFIKISKAGANLPSNKNWNPTNQQPNSNQNTQGWNMLQQAVNQGQQQGWGQPAQNFNQPYQQAWGQPGQTFNQPAQTFNQPGQTFNQPQQNWNQGQGWNNQSSLPDFSKHKVTGIPNLFNPNIAYTIRTALNL
jgi:hypothetical protein